jgi:multiple sugar transport system substrate-binding protein
MDSKHLKSCLISFVTAGLFAVYPTAQASAEEILKVAYSSDYTPLTSEAGTKLWADIISDFEKANPGVRVKPIKIPGSYAELTNKLGLLFRSPDTAPDVAEVPNQDIVQWIEAGFFADMSNFVANDPIWNGIPDSVKNETRYDGKVYGISHGENSMILAYDKTLFKKAGLPMPWQPKNWADILAAGRKIKAADPKAWPLWIQTGTAQGSSGAAFGPNSLIAGSSDPTIYDVNTKKWVVDSKGIREVIEFYKTASAEGLLAPASQLLGISAATIPDEAIPKHEIGVGLVGNWTSVQWLKQVSAPYYPDASAAVAFVPFPTKDGQPPGIASALSGFNLSIYANSRKKDLAWKFIQTSLTKKNMLQAALANGWIPPVTKIAFSKEWLDTDPFQSVPNGVLSISKPVPVKSGYSAWAMGLMTATEAVVLDPKLSVDDAVGKMKEYVENELGPDVIEAKR